MNPSYKPDLNKLRGVANYQFGKNVGTMLFTEDIKVKYSTKTGRARLIFEGNELLATLKPTNGLMALSLAGAKKLRDLTNPPHSRVVVDDDARPFVAKGLNVPARHVVNAGKEILPSDEVIVTDQNDEVLAVGKALLTGKEMLVFKRGIAVKVRKGCKEV
jgi:predicted RNA-binding protein (TIGR00451 family)